MPRAMSTMPDPKKQQLSISLTEPVAFLRSSDPSGRQRSDPNDYPTLVRGLVTLNVVKPIKISNIEVELTGIMTVSWVEGVGARRMEMTEEQKIHSSTVTVFSAAQDTHQRRTMSVGPGLSLAYPTEQDDSAGTSTSRPVSSHQASTANTDFGGLSATEEPPFRDASHDNASPARGAFDFHFAGDLGPTPPYTPARASAAFQSRQSTQESPAQTLEDLRQALRDNLEGQGHWRGYASAPPSAHLHSTPFAPLSAGYSNTAGFPNVSSQREYERGSPYLDSVSLSRHPSLEEPPQLSLSPYRGVSSRRTSRANSPENLRGTTPRRENSRDPSYTRAGRTHSRFSLSAVLGAVKEVTSRSRSSSRGFTGTEERERGRTRVRLTAAEDVGNVIPEAAEGVTDADNNIIQNGLENTQPLLGFGRILGLDRDRERDKEGEVRSREQSEGWKEFKPGTYTYPISFLLPPNLPPSFSLPHGSLNYTLKAVAHRPGTFTSKLSCQTPLLVVAAPSIGAGEGGGAGDPGPVIVEKQWEGKLAYVFGLSGRLFVLGSQRRLQAAANERVHLDTESQVERDVEARADAAYGTAILELTMMPLEKVKIWRLAVSIDEQVSVVDQGAKAMRVEEKRRVTLLELQDSCFAEELAPVDEDASKQKNKQKKKETVQIPLLPSPLSPHRSPLLPYIPSSADPSTVAGPGPYTISTTVGLPGCHDIAKGGQLHFTLKQKNSWVRVEHHLRLTLRVEVIGDNESNEFEEVSKKKMFDVAVQTPITILSCRCLPEYQALPRYSQFVEDATRNLSACPCKLDNSAPSGANHDHDHAFGPILRSSASTSSLDSDVAAARGSHDQAQDPTGQPRSSRSTSRPQSQSLSRAPSASGRNDHGRPPHPTHAHAHVHSHSRSHSYVHGYSPTPISTPHPSRPPSPLARYQRLVSGLESEAGEAPPSYESVAANA